jgi:hypothetical protein
MQYKFCSIPLYRRAPKNLKEVIQYIFGLSVVQVVGPDLCTVKAAYVVVTAET